MCSKRFALSLLGIAAGLLVAAFPAAGKDGVKATLETAIPLDAPAGTRLHIAWKLANPAGRPFGAGGVYVRLLSASGAPAETGVAPSDSQSMGEYAATVAVPEGGIGDVVIGLRGWTSGASGTHRADLLFSITNDPLPGALSSQATGTPTWIFVLAAGSLLALSVAAVALVRRRKQLLKPLLPPS